MIGGSAGRVERPADWGRGESELLTGRRALERPRRRRWIKGAGLLLQRGALGSVPAPPSQNGADRQINRVRLFLEALELIEAPAASFNLPNRSRSKARPKNALWLGDGHVMARR